MNDNENEVTFHLFRDIALVADVTHYHQQPLTETTKTNTQKIL